MYNIYTSDVIGMYAGYNQSLVRARERGIVNSRRRFYFMYDSARPLGVDTTPTRRGTRDQPMVTQSLEYAFLEKNYPSRLHYLTTLS